MKGEVMVQTITTEMGVPTSSSQLVQAPMPWMLLQYYVDLGRSSTLEERRAGVLGDVLVRREPVGLIAAIVPWNLPAGRHQAEAGAGAAWRRGVSSSGLTDSSP